MNTRYSFCYRTGSTWEYVLAGCLVSVLVMIGAEKISNAGAIPAELLLYAVSILLIAAIVWHGLFDRRPVIVLSSDGVWFRGWGANPDAYLPWSLISEVKEVPAARGMPFICLQLKDEANAISALGLSEVRQNARWWRFLGCTPFTLRVVLLNVSHKEVFELLRKFVLRSKA